MRIDGIRVYMAKNRVIDSVYKHSYRRIALMSKMMTEVGGFQGVPTDCQLMVAKLVMQRQQLESVHNMVMPREFRNAIDKGQYLTTKRRLLAKEWSTCIKDADGNLPVQRS